MMKESNFRQLLTSALLAGLVLTSGVFVQAQDAKKAEPVRKATITLTGDVILNGFEDGIKWLGVSATDVPEILKTHMPELKEQGVLIKLVLKDSPAEKAGIKVNDILLALNDTKIKKMTDLVTAVQNSKGPKGVAEILRAGKRLEISVLLTKRAEYLKADLLMPPEALEAWKPSNTTPTRLRFFGPGHLVPSTMLIKAEKLPENLSILISRKGNAPATVTVKMDGKKWETTEDKLEDLPVEIRKHIEKNLKVAGVINFSGEKRVQVMPDGGRILLGGKEIRIISPNGTLTANSIEFTTGADDKINKSPQQITEHRIVQMKKLLEQQQPDKTVRNAQQQQSNQQFQQLKKLIEQLQKDVSELKKQTRTPQKQQPRASRVLKPVESVN